MSTGYAPGVQAGIALSSGGRMALWPWPDAIEGLGKFQGAQPLARCKRCKPGTHPVTSATFVRFGGVPVCRVHAQESKS
jgi:hypothetical protein